MSINEVLKKKDEDTDPRSPKIDFLMLLGDRLRVGACFLISYTLMNAIHKLDL